MTIAEIYESAKRRLDKDEITIGEFCNIVDITVDAYKVSTAKWINDPKYSYSEIKICSNCKEEAYWDTDYGQQLFNYCPYCGARMTESADKE